MFDIVLAMLATLLSVSLFLSVTGDSSVPPGTGWVLILLVIHNGVLALRRIHPAPVLATVLASGLLVLAIGWPTVVLGLAVVVAVYTAGAELPRVPSFIALAAALAAIVLGAVITRDDADLSTYVGNAGVLAAAWFIGTTLRSRREYASSLEQRNRELEEARDELARKAVGEERVRIARELHDVIAHNMSLIAVQAGAGRSIIDTDPAEAKRSLGIIEETSRSALGETRRVLGLLRDPGQGSAFEPAPSLGELEHLLEGVQGAGLEVRLERSGDLSSLSPGLQLALYRIVQEALTNVMKHSGAKKSHVSIARDNGLVQVDVIDDGSGSGDRMAEGTGLRGMKERVDAYGGRFEAGDLPEGGFRVSISVPVSAG